jgi:hypothetical protein
MSLLARRDFARIHYLRAYSEREGEAPAEPSFPSPSPTH